MSIDVTYEEIRPYSFDGCGFANHLLESDIFNVLTLGKLHVLIHELGHALAEKMVTGAGSTITVSSVGCYGVSAAKEDLKKTRLQWTFVLISGPLANIIFSLGMMLGFGALTHYVSMNPYLALSLKIWAIASNGIWIIGELFYAIVSTSKRDSGDFGQIRKNGWGHLVASWMIVMTLIGVGLTGTAWFSHPFKLHF